MTKKYFTRLLQASLMCCLAVLFTACDEVFGSEDNPIPAYLSMSTSDVTIKVGDTYKRTAIAVSTAVVEYSSDKPEVATVDANGTVTGVAAGEAKITATATGYSSASGKKIFETAKVSYKVIVKPNIATITTYPKATTGDIVAGSTTALVTAGVADGGTVMYAVTTANTKPTTTDGFSATVPTAATLAAATYYVWYYAKADATHVDGEIAATAIEVTVKTSGLLAGKFTINGNSTNNQVQFSQGNLQATWDGTSWTWAFAEHQWDYIGNAAGNTSINGDGTVSAANVTVDLFGWVGASNTTWTGAAKYGISNSTTTNNATTYGNVAAEALRSDWGNTMDVDWSNKTGESTTGWRTLTSAEWTYLFNTRTTGGTVFGTAQARYAHATINTDVSGGVNGIILFPDGVDIAASEVTTAGTVNGVSSWGTKCTSAEWTALAAKGCVFLPAAGYRSGTSMNGIGTMGLYWSSSPYTGVAPAYCVYFYSSHLKPDDYFVRSYGFPVRLVRDAE